MKQLMVSAPAKLNLALDILRRRPDGYHDLKMVMQTISLCDVVTVRTGTGTGRTELRSPGAGLPSGEKNLAFRAARAFFAATGAVNDGVEIELEKHIPMQAGLAGGSADGAAVLRALQSAYGEPDTESELEAIAFAIGSDLPFCVRGGTALAEGRGELLTDLPKLPPCWIAVCKPAFGLSTPDLFARVRVGDIRCRPDFAALHAALETRNLPEIAGLLCNVFEPFLTEEEHREIAAIRDALRIGGALGTAMTGSGPAVFGLFDREEAARETVRTLRRQYAQVFLAKPL